MFISNKGTKRYSKIRFIEIYKHLGLNFHNKAEDTKRKRIVKDCESLFGFWKDETKILKDWMIDIDKELFKIKVNDNEIETLAIISDYEDIAYNDWMPEGYVSMNEIKDALQILAESGLGLESMLDFLEEVSVEID